MGDKFYFEPGDDARQDAELGSFRDHIRHSIDRLTPALEIGPSFNPTLEKRAGYDLTIIDYTDEVSLREIHARQGMAPDCVDRIEPVDLVWSRGTMSDLAGTGRFDAIVACHVIEHAPDFVGFLQDCRRMLRSAGKIYLLVPDRRYCFDYFQPLSDVAKVLDDHEAKRDRHPFASFYRHGTHASAIQNASRLGAWSQGGIAGIELDPRDPFEMLSWARSSASSEAYVDSHANVFTPSSFAAILTELAYLTLLDLRISLLTRTRYCEFLVVLSAGSPALSLAEFRELKRRFLISQMKEELERITAATAILQQINPLALSSPARP